jgi:hypothetical protein
VWLLMIEPGRYRVLSDSEVQLDQDLREVRSLIVDGPAPPDGPATAFEPNARAARIGRLILTTLAPPRPSWRLTVPKHITQGNRERLVLLFSQGYLELWLTDVYTAATAAQLDSAV